jgi:hypothetical protein
LLRRGSSGKGHVGPWAEEVDGDDLGELLAALAEPVAALAEPLAMLAMEGMSGDREASPWRR